MNDWQKRVTDFMRAVGHPSPSTPALSGVRRSLRAALILEECLETIDALGFQVIDRRSNEALTFADLELKSTNEARWASVVDGLVDQIYVVIGTAVEMGLDLNPFFQEVHRSNMSKVGAPETENGKLQKGSSYRPPQIAKMLRERLLCRKPCAEPSNDG